MVLAVINLKPGGHDPIASVDRHRCGAAQPLAPAPPDHGVPGNHVTVSAEVAVDMAVGREAGEAEAEGVTGHDYAAAGIDRR